MLALGKLLILAGFAFLLLGAAIVVLARTGWLHSLPLGRLPGDISYRGKGFSVFAPLGTSLLLSLILSGMLYLLTRLRR